MSDAKDRARRKIHRIYEDAVSRSQSDERDYGMLDSIDERIERIEGVGGKTTSIPIYRKGKWQTLTVPVGSDERDVAALLPAVQATRKELPELFDIIRRQGNE